MADTCLYTTESVKQLQFVEANLLAKGRGNLTVKDSGAESFCAKTVVALSLFLGLLIADASGQSASQPLRQPKDDFDNKQSNGLTSDQIQEGWLALFDGRSLYGWKAESKADWQVSDREIRVSGGEMGLLRTTSQFDDFELLLEFKAGPKTNSGILSLIHI